jgi:hypothetical protein
MKPTTTNIEGDYLWDKTGEPDPEIQQLEEILGTLRYQPRALEIPADLHGNIQIRRERSFFRGSAPGLAIAATIALVVLGLGLWFGLQRLQRSQPSVVQTPNQPAISNPSTAPSPNQVQQTTASVPGNPDQKQIDAPRRHRVNPSLQAGNRNQSPAARKGLDKNLVQDSAVAENNLQEGAAAKDQLMLGLRVACAKINFAQKKAQESTNPRDLIHNQHKIG